MALLGFNPFSAISASWQSLSRRMTVASGVNLSGYICIQNFFCISHQSWKSCWVSSMRNRPCLEESILASWGPLAHRHPCLLVNVKLTIKASLVLIDEVLVVIRVALLLVVIVLWAEGACCEEEKKTEATAHGQLPNSGRECKWEHFYSRSPVSELKNVCITLLLSRL